MPGDYDIEYASPWAGADYLPSVNQVVPFAIGWSSHRVEIDPDIVVVSLVKGLISQNGNQTHGSN